MQLTDCAHCGNVLAYCTCPPRPRLLTDRCARCGHQSATHDAGRCFVGSCSCTGFPEPAPRPTTGKHGWPLVPSTRFPGETTLACPQCASTDITLTGAYGPGGRLGDPGGHEITRCNACRHQALSPSK